MGGSSKANDYTGVPKELQRWDGMIARMDPDRARNEQRKQENRNNYEANVARWAQNLKDLRELRAERAVRARQVRAHPIPCRAVPASLPPCPFCATHIGVHSTQSRWNAMCCRNLQPLTSTRFLGCPVANVGCRRITA